MRFFRLDTDRNETPLSLEGQYAGGQSSACWLIGGGPSLSSLPIDEIAASSIPKMAINLAGSRLLRPTFWTAYDPTVRFHKSVYLDPGVTKFVNRRRAMDVVPESTLKVCECPNLVFFEGNREQTYGDFLSPSATGIVDWADTMVQAIDILYRLGFRAIYLAGCEMFVRPSEEQIAAAKTQAVEYVPRERLVEFLNRCESAGLSASRLDEMKPAEAYHFGEWKPIRAAANTDEHYYRITQYLRLSRTAIANAGLRLVSVTPHSRLNDFFEYRPAKRVLGDIRRTVGDPRHERVDGLYRQPASRTPTLLCPMRDFPSPGRRHRDGRPAGSSRTVLPSRSENEPEVLVEYEGPARLASKIAAMRRERLSVNEEG